jgi:hypothetical protein
VFKKRVLRKKYGSKREEITRLDKTPYLMINSPHTAILG